MAFEAIIKQRQEEKARRDRQRKAGTRTAARTVGELIAILSKLPPEACVYGTDDGEVAVHESTQPAARHLMHVDLTGI